MSLSSGGTAFTAATHRSGVQLVSAQELSRQSKQQRHVCFMDNKICHRREVDKSPVRLIITQDLGLVEEARGVLLKVV